MKRYRYPGPQPFSGQYQKVFFGREKEIEELYRIVRREPWLVLYGKSGQGKSSLLNAGLAPRLAADDNTLPVFIRFQAWTPERTDTPLSIATDILREQAGPVTDWLDSLQANDPSLWRILKEMQMHDNKRPVLLIFDQFEELFTFPKPDIEAFARSLAEVFYTDIPERYRTALGHNPELLDEAQLLHLHEPLLLRVITAIRTDRMALLHQLKPHLPNTFDTLYELKPLSPAAAEEAVLNPAYDNGDFITPQFDFTDGALDALLAFLSADGEQNIEAFQLQILCEHFEKNTVARHGRTRIDVDDMADPEDILEHYYINKIAEIQDPEARLAARKLIEEGLVFEEEERRLSLFEGQIHRNWQVTHEQLLNLENTHLLRREPNLRGGYTYELSHDTLVGAVLKAKTKRRSEEAQIEKEKEEKRKAAELEHLRKVAELERQKAEEADKLREAAETGKLKAQKHTYISASMLVFAIVAWSIAYAMYLKAQKQNVELKIQKEISEDRLHELYTIQAKRDLETIRDIERNGDVLFATNNYLPAEKKYKQAIEFIQFSSVQDSLKPELKRLTQKLSNAQNYLK